MPRRFDLQDFLPYLLNRAGMRIGVMFSHDVAPYGVTLPMWRVLLELWNGGDHRLGDLAERTTIDLSTLSRLIVAMQRQRLVTRRRSGSDGRALSLTLTAKGTTLVETIAPFALYYEKLAMKGLTSSEIAELKRLLRKVFANLDHASKEKAAAAKPARRRAQVVSRKKK